MEGFSSDEDEDEASLGISSNDVCLRTTLLPQLKPRAKENDPPAKRTGVTDVNSSTENHFAKQDTSNMLLFQESAYSKLGDLDDMFDDDEYDDNMVSK